MRPKHVLVSVLKEKSDLPLLLTEKWYRIPLAFLPKRAFTHIAFYQPEGVGETGKRIAYYARVAKREVVKRRELLPRESSHPRADDDYLKCSFTKIETLAEPIQNVVPRRVSFGFTDLATLRSAKDILELYHVAPTEQMIEEELRHLGVLFSSQHRLSYKGKRFRLDLALFCRDGKIAIECDNRKAHSSKKQKQKDRQKDKVLRYLGWTVIRLTEKDILKDSAACMFRIQKAVHSLGGMFRQ